MDEMEQEDRSSREEALDILQAELGRINAELRDISDKLDQSRGQVDQLAQRNAMLLGEVRRIEGALDQTPRLTIKDTYDDALDSQQRLLAVRSQMEKLQAQEAVAKNQVETLKTVIELLRKDTEKAQQEAASSAEVIIRVINAQEEEREKLARQMHDGPAHALTNFILQAEICEKLFDKSPNKAREELSNLKTAAREAFQRVRAFIFDLRPMMLTDLGLVPTLKRYLDAFEDKTGVSTDFVMSGRERRLQNYREVLLFRGVQELMTNARDHGGADSIKVTLDMMSDEVVRAVVEDNGRGFGTGKLTLEAGDEKSLGLSTLQERLSLVNGTLQIESVTGQGTEIEISIPAGPEVEESSEYNEVVME